MSHVVFENVLGKKIAINADQWIALGPASGGNGTGIMLTQDVLIEVVGPMDEVLAALESATAPPVAAAVEVAPTDLEIAAKMLDLFAEADIRWAFVDRALGLGDVGWDDTRGALRALAAKLRGSG